jgi:hypothetical protein
MTTDFPTAPSAYGLNGPSANVTVEKSIHASHTEILTPPQERFSCVSTWCREIQGGEFGNQTYSGGALSFSLSIAATITFDSIESRKAKEHYLRIAKGRK